MHMYYGIIVFFKKRSKKYVTYEHGRIEQFKCKKKLSFSMLFHNQTSKTTT